MLVTNPDPAPLRRIPRPAAPPLSSSPGGLALNVSSFRTTGPDDFTRLSASRLTLAPWPYPEAPCDPEPPPAPAPPPPPRATTSADKARKKPRPWALVNRRFGWDRPQGDAFVYVGD